MKTKEELDALKAELKQIKTNILINMLALYGFVNLVWDLSNFVIWLFK